MTLRERIVAAQAVVEAREQQLERALALLDANTNAEELIALLTTLGIIPIFPGIPPPVIPPQ
jgi:hypothetical protein